MFVDQLLCMKQVVAADGSVSKVVSLDVLLANAVPFAAGFCLFYFIFNNMIWGNKKDA